MLGLVLGLVTVYVLVLGLVLVLVAVVAAAKNGVVKAAKNSAGIAVVKWAGEEIAVGGKTRWGGRGFK